MTLLAVETATRVCSVAVAADETLLAELSLNVGKVHAEKLAAVADLVLREAGVDPAAVDVLAVSAGPGSFTGLRIGLAFAKGFVLPGGQRLVLVPTLMALALRAGAMGRVVCPILRARRGELYVALYEGDGYEMVPLAAEQVLQEKDLADFVPPGALLTGEIEQLEPETLAALEARGQVQFAARWLRDASASAVAQLGFLLARRGQFADPDTCEPRYLQEFVARKMGSLVNRG